MFFSEFVFFVLLVKGVREDHVMSAELSGTKCTYPVSHNRTYPHWMLYHIGKIRDAKATNETCHDFCNKDVNCRSVLYAIHADRRRWCAKFNISIQELKDTDRDKEILTATDTDKFPTWIIYDRYCAGKHCGQPSIPPKFGSSRIIGGMEATPGSWPWQISMKFDTIDYGIYEYWCGGTIISDKWILTAAHCFDESRSPLSYSIRVGDHDELSEDVNEVTHTISSIVVHENYDSQTLDNDIALMQVTVPIQFNDHVSHVCLPTRHDQLKEGDYVYITGFGTTYGNFDDVLKQARVPIRNREECTKAYKELNPVTQNMFCSGIGGQDTCQGDSGGPLVSRLGSTWSIHGITSWGVGCAEPKYPGVYAKVVNYLDWIENKMV